MMVVAEVAFATLEAAFRWTLLFAIAWFFLRRIHLSAAARHHLWAMLLAGLLLLPAAVTVLPSYGVSRPTVLETLDGIAGAVRGDAAPSAAGEQAGVDAGEAVQADVHSSGVSRSPSGADVPLARDRAEPGSVVRTFWPWLWLAGTVGLLGFWIVGQFAVPSLAAPGSVAPESHAALLRACARSMGIGRRVRLLRSREDLVPMTWGWFHPVVLLPAESVSWSHERLRRVLLHELAHVARFDPFVQSMARIACSVFWFHPAAWYAAHSLRREAELACDDQVLQAEGTPFAYAEDLLSIAGTLRAVPRAASALPMARQRGLDQRIRALLESGRRRGLSRWLASGFTLGAVALVTTVAVVQWSDPAGGGHERNSDWLHGSALEDGRSVWSMDCGSGGEPICVDGSRRAVALLERTGRTGAVIAQDVVTGEIVAYAAVRAPGAGPGDAMPSVAAGSVAKLALTALWWESEWADSLAACPAETRLPSGRPLRNAGGYASGPLTAERMLVVSCNTAAVAMAARLIDSHGAPDFALGLERLGLAANAGGMASGSRIRRVAFDGAAASVAANADAGRSVGRSEADDLLLLAGLGMDRSTTTPLQISQLLQAVGNDGRQLAAVPVGGSDPRSEPQQVMGRETAARLRQAMLRVVGEGTAARALPQLEWSQWTLGGKTGSIPNAAGDLDGWFAGLAHGPEGRAEYTIVVLVEGGGVGGGAPAGIAAEMTRLFARIRGDEL